MREPPGGRRRRGNRRDRTAGDARVGRGRHLHLERGCQRILDDAVELAVCRRRSQRRLSERRGRPGLLHGGIHRCAHRHDSRQRDRHGGHDLLRRPGRDLGCRGRHLPAGSRQRVRRRTGGDDECLDVRAERRDAAPKLVADDRQPGRHAQSGPPPRGRRCAFGHQAWKRPHGFESAQLLHRPHEGRAGGAQRIRRRWWSAAGQPRDRHRSFPGHVPDCGRHSASAHRDHRRQGRRPAPGGLCRNRAAPAHRGRPRGGGRTVHRSGTDDDGGRARDDSSQPAAGPGHGDVEQSGTGDDQPLCQCAGQCSLRPAGFRDDAPGERRAGAGRPRDRGETLGGDRRRPDQGGQRHPAPHGDLGQHLCRSDARYGRARWSWRAMVPLR